MPDLIPKEGDQGFRKRKTLKLEGFDDEEYYAIVSIKCPHSNQTNSIDFFDLIWADRGLI